MTRSIVGVVLGILLLVAAAGAVSFLTLAFSVSQAVGMTAATTSVMRAARNITASGEFDELRQLPGIPSLRQWAQDEPLVTAFVAVLAFLFACYCNHAMQIQRHGWRRARDGISALVALATRHVAVIVTFLFIGYVLVRTDTVSDSEIAQFQHMVAGKIG